MVSTKGSLYLVGMPIGNLEDLTLRAIRILKEVDLIACEDTRETLKILNHLGIKKTLVSYHKFNEQSKGLVLIEEVLKGKNIALVSDAGMPGISDPGEVLVNLAYEAGVKPEVIPGPSAFSAGLVISGLGTKEFYFAGFLPKGSNKERLFFVERMRFIKGTLIFYVSPHSLTKDLTLLREVLGDVKASLVREITKKFEEVRRGSLSDLYSYSLEEGKKGEMVLYVESPFLPAVKEMTIEKAYEIYLENLESGQRSKEALKHIAETYKVSKNQLYEYILEQKKEEVKNE